MIAAQRNTTMQNLADISAGSAAAIATCVTAVAGVVAGWIALRKHGNEGRATLRHSRVTSNARMIDQLMTRVSSLEMLSATQQTEIANLHKTVLELARENERLRERNRYLESVEEKTEAIRQEKHDIANKLNAAALTMVHLKNELNKADIDAGRAPRFTKPNEATLE